MRPPLYDPRQEAFAQARALGLPRHEAAARADCAIDPAEADCLDRLLVVQTRIEQIKALWSKARGADLANTVAGLLDMAEAWSPTGPAVAMREARLARLEAHRLWEAHESRERAGRPGPDLGEPELSEDEWIERFGASRADLPAEAP